MNKLIITRWNKYILTALLSEKEAVELSALPDGEDDYLGNIYVGKVQKIVKNINSAFVEYEKGKMGYYSLSENTAHVYTQPGEHKQLREGDEILVQVAKESVKTKDPVLTSILSFTGKYVVLTYGKNTIGFSQKLKKDDVWKQQLRGLLETEQEDNLGIIVRTNGQEAESDQILSEVRRLKAHCQQVLGEAAYRTCYSRVYQSQSGFVRQVLDCYTSELEMIITDQTDLYQGLHRHLSEAQPEDLAKLRLYEDSQVSLFQLYRLQRILDEAVGRRVWLKSGGYLVIEPTEALTVVDVNTGKYAGRKNKEETILKINLEAADEIARQLRLRNITGIIVIDFIDMKKEESRKELLRSLGRKTALDPVKTTVIDMTALNLVELTRKKGRRPLAEQLMQEKRME